MTQTPPLTDGQLDAALDALADDAGFSPADLARLRAHVVIAAGGDAGPAAAPHPAAAGGTVVPLAARARRHRRGWAALVAVAVLALVATLAVVVHVGRSSGTGPAGTRAEVTCLVDAGRSAAGDVDRARALVSARLAGLAASGTAVTSTEVVTDGSGRLDVSADGIEPDELATLCTSPLPTLRPLLGAPVTLTTASAGTVVPRLPDPLPTSDAALAALPAAERQTIAAAAADSDCPAATDAPVAASVVACDSGDTPTSAYLLGPAVVAPAGITDAQANPPVAGPGAADGWTVTVAFGPDADADLGAYTGAHDTGGVSPVYTVDQCGATTTPCGDFLAVVVGGAVVSAPVITSEITGTLQVTGSFSETAARLLAAQFAAGDLTLVVA